MSKVGADNIVFGYHKVHLVGHAAQRAEVFFGPEIRARSTAKLVSLLDSQSNFEGVERKF